MAKKLIYFTAGPNATSTENTEIALLMPLNGKGYNIYVRNGAEKASFGSGIEDCDLVAGTVPTSHNAKTVFSIDATKPTSFCLSPATAAIVGTATKQLTPIAISGSSLDALTAAVPASGVTYVSSVPGKATVSAGGLVTGVAAGQTTITATYTFVTGKTLTATCVVTVS